MLNDQSVPTGVRRWRAGLLLLFFATGIAIASWVTRTPDIRDAIHASTTQMGLVLVGMSVGSMSGILVAPTMVTRHGGRRVTIVGAALMVLGLAVMATGAGAGSSWLIAGGLALLGAGTGSTEIAQNVEGAAVERVTGTVVLPVLHGCFSAGTVLGAVAGIVLDAHDVSVSWHLGVAAALMAGAAAWTVSSLPAHTGREERPSHPRAQGRSALRERWGVFAEPRVLMLGLIIFGMALAEGSASDWLPLISVDDFASTSVVGALVYTVFAAAMATGRLTGGRFLHRYGRVPVMRACAGMAVVGIALVAFTPGASTGGRAALVEAGAGVLLWGLGASLGFPVTISAAGEDADRSALRVGAVATAGYIAFLAGPPLLGLVGDHVGLRHAMLIVLLAVVAGVGCTRALRPADPVTQQSARAGATP